MPEWQNGRKGLKRLADVGEQGATMKMIGGGQFANVIIENLLKAGVRNTVKNERLRFDRPEVHPGQWVHAEGQYTQVGAGPRACPETRRVAVCIGPEHGTVGPELVKEAAQGIGFDLLLVCGFAFDPHVSEEATIAVKVINHYGAEVLKVYDVNAKKGSAR